MKNQGNEVSSKLKELAKHFDTNYPDATVLIDNNPNNDYNDLIVSVYGDDQDEVSTLAMDIAGEARGHPTVAELGGRESVSPTVVDDEKPHFEYEVTVRV